MSHLNIEYPPKYSTLNNDSNEQTNALKFIRSSVPIIESNLANSSSLITASTNTTMVNTTASTVLYDDNITSGWCKKSEKPILNVKGEKQISLNNETMEKKIDDDRDQDDKTKFDEKFMRRYFESQLDNIRNGYRRYFKELYTEKLKLSRKYYKEYYQKKYEDNMRKYRHEWDDFYADCFGLYYQYGGQQRPVKRTNKRNPNDPDYYPYMNYCSDDDVFADDEFELDDDLELLTNAMKTRANQTFAKKSKINSKSLARQNSKRSLKNFFGSLKKNLHRLY